jgi:hypothetical protein
MYLAGKEHPQTFGTRQCVFHQLNESPGCYPLGEINMEGLFYLCCAET